MRTQGEAQERPRRGCRSTRPGPRPVSKLPDRLMPKAADILSRLLELPADEQIGVLAAVAAAFCYNRDHRAPGHGGPRERK
jgi:hypothetical protein